MMTRERGRNINGSKLFGLAINIHLEEPHLCLEN